PYAQWHRDHGIAAGVLDKWWNPIALSMGFLPAYEMSARPMTTVFHHFSRHADASRVGFLDGPPSERLHQPFADYIQKRGGEVVCNARAAQLLVDTEGLNWAKPKNPELRGPLWGATPRVTGVRLETGQTLEADGFVIAA